MRALLDVNVLIALFDQDHSLHERARDWFAANALWASCPITQNGCIRIMSHARYPNPLPVGAVIFQARNVSAVSGLRPVRCARDAYLAPVRGTPPIPDRRCSDAAPAP